VPRAGSHRSGAAPARSTAARLAVVAVVAVHVPLAVVVAVGLAWDLGAMPLAALAWATAVAGTAAVVVHLHLRLRPVADASRRLRRYLHLGVLDTGGPYADDEIGQLLAELDEVCRRLDTARRDAERAATVDHVTGALTRRATEARLEELARQVRRRDDRLTIALVDLDHFKAVNDELGHAAGDAALREAAEVLGRALRGVGVVGRWGGDELLVGVRGPCRDVAAGLERARRAIEDRLAGVLGRRVTTSIGVAELGPLDTVTGCVAVADGALYVAKARGRDQLVDAGAPVLHLP